MSFLDRIRRTTEEPAPEINDSTSILSRTEVQRSLAGGAPATPWLLRKEDRQAMDMLATYFARAIPVPTPDGRVTVRESLGHGGPQLELYVPVLSSKNPVAVLARNWHSGQDLEADLFFFGAPDGRLASIVKKLGFLRRDDVPNTDVSVFRAQQRLPQKRAS